MKPHSRLFHNLVGEMCCSDISYFLTKFCQPTIINDDAGNIFPIVDLDVYKRQVVMVCEYAAYYVLHQQWRWRFC